MTHIIYNKETAKALGLITYEDHDTAVAEAIRAVSEDGWNEIVVANIEATVVAVRKVEVKVVGKEGVE